MKKIVIAILIFVLALALYLTFIHESASPANFIFTLKDDGTYSAEINTLQYCSKIKLPDTYKGKPVTEISKQIKTDKESEDTTDIVLPDLLRSVLRFVFSGHTRLKRVTLPDTVTVIGNRAFSECRSLESISISESVTRIGAKAFNNCDSLTSIVIPDSVTEIDVGAFISCNNLRSVILPRSITSISALVFQGCGIPTITIPDNVKSIETGAFSYSGITEITIPDSVTNIDIGAFDCCTSLQSVTIGSGIETIEQSVFRGCTSLTSVVIPDNIVSIDNFAFHDCDSLASVTLGTGLTSIGVDAFIGCYQLVEVINLSSLELTDSMNDRCGIAKYAKIVHTSDSKLIDLDGFLFISVDGTNYLLGSVDKKSSIVLPSDFNGESYEIYNFAFRNDKSLTDIIIPSGVKGIGNSAFWGCNNLKSIKYCGTEEAWSSIAKGRDWDEYSKFGYGSSRINYKMIYNYSYN